VIGSTDVNSRLPRFREALDSIADIEKRGGFEGVSPQVMDYLKAAEPVGLGEYLQIQLPDGHDPRTTPAVLMLRPEEYEYRLVHRETEPERQAANAIIALTGEHMRTWPGLLSGRSPAFGNFAAATLATGVPVLPQGGKRWPYAIAVPRVIVVKDEEVVPAPLLGAILAHEADHWDFHLHEAGVLRNPFRHPNATPMRLVATAEKRAYTQTSRRIEANLGHYAMGRPEDVAQAHAGITPAEAPKLLLPNERNKHLFPDGNIPLSLAVGAVGLLFGQAGLGVATREETTALTMMGVIQPPFGPRPETPGSAKAAS